MAGANGQRVDLPLRQQFKAAAGPDLNIDLLIPIRAGTTGILICRFFHQRTLSGHVHIDRDTPIDIEFWAWLEQSPAKSVDPHIGIVFLVK